MDLWEFFISVFEVQQLPLKTNRNDWGTCSFGTLMDMVFIHIEVAHRNDTTRSPD